MRSVQALKIRNFFCPWVLTCRAWILRLSRYAGRPSKSSRDIIVVYWIFVMIAMLKIHEPRSGNFYLAPEFSMHALERWQHIKHSRRFLKYSGTLFWRKVWCAGWCSACRSIKTLSSAACLTARTSLCLYRSILIRMSCLSLQLFLNLSCSFIEI